MWKLGVIEAEDVCREVVRSICDMKSKYNIESKQKLTKEVMKKRAQGIHHIGEKFKAVANRLKNDKKKGFTVQDFLDEEKKKQDGRPNGPDNSNNEPAAAPEPEPEATPAPTSTANDVD